MTLIKPTWKFDPWILDTTPGCNAWCPFSPPSDFEGGGAEYLSLMRGRFRDPSYSRFFRERIRVLNSGSTIHFDGPYSTEAMTVLGKICEKQFQPKRAS